MGYHMVFQYVYTLCKNQIMVKICPFSSNIYHFFMMRTYKILSISIYIFVYICIYICIYMYIYIYTYI
jgi:hypothetical protein